MVFFFDKIPPEKHSQVGGKAASLAQMTEWGLPVPAGFVILAENFLGEHLTPEGWTKIQNALSNLRSTGASAFAVRSSALSEDSAQASFAGEFESLLNVTSDSEIRAAIEAVWASRQNERVQAYSIAQGISTEHQMAVIVQQMVAADYAGVLFTADPVTGSHASMPGDFVAGLGEKLVAGETNASSFVLKRPRGRYQGPVELKGYASPLFKLATTIEENFGFPQDIEFAIANRKVYILQSRPITTMQNYSPLTGEQNDSLLGDYLWANTNVGEAIPDVMTPLTWSLMKEYFRLVSFGKDSDWLAMGGNIGGRLYFNISMFGSVFLNAGMKPHKFQAMLEDGFGKIPPDIEIPVVPFTRWQALKTFIPGAFRQMKRVGSLKKTVNEFVASAPEREKAYKEQILAARNHGELLHIWRTNLRATILHTLSMLAAGTSDYKNLSRSMRARLNELVGEADTNALMSGIAADEQTLESVGPIIGLAKIVKGELSEKDYLARFGHRGPSEIEISIATPGEDPKVFAVQLQEAHDNPIDPAELLQSQRQQHAEAWQRFLTKYPKLAKKIREKLERMNRAARERETNRSAVVRMLRIMRTYAQQAGKITGLADQIFFLSIDEIEAALKGDLIPQSEITARQAAYDRQVALPAYPSIIRGRFDPEDWAQDENRRSDIYDATRTAPLPEGDTIKGFAGSPGVVEASVRVLASLAESQQFQAGEILVASTTNIGWTPLFPRAAAIITDIGAPLSHAAIVARELGIPAVVGTGNATMRLKTGDRVRVHGGQGIVEILE